MINKLLALFRRKPEPVLTAEQEEKELRRKARAVIEAILKQCGSEYKNLPAGLKIWHDNQHNEDSIAYDSTALKHGGYHGNWVYLQRNSVLPLFIPLLELWNTGELTQRINAQIAKLKQDEVDYQKRSVELEERARKLLKEAKDV